MNRRDSIPTDLVVEILSRLPAKSIARCRCVSKLWGSMLLNPYFTELFMTRSLARPPNLLFSVKGSEDWCFLTSPHPQNPDEKPGSLAPDLRMKFPREFCESCDRRHRLKIFGHASGFILFRRRVWGKDDDTMTLLGICNPSTGQYASLPTPKLAGKVKWRSFLGFDPIEKQFKLLSITNPLDEEKQEPAQILTLGAGNNSWRNIHCPLNHSTLDISQGICINGVLYYFARQRSPLPSLIVCFDVRSEKFKFIYREYDKKDTKLVNYKGVLGMIRIEYSLTYNPGGRTCNLKLRMWVMKDVENLESEWSEGFSFCWDDEIYVNECNLSIAGVTATGEIVLSRTSFHAYVPFYVIYINWERNTVQKVEIQGLQANYSNHYEVEVFADYVENLNFITIMETAKCNSVTTSTSSKAPHLQQNGPTTLKSINKFDSLCLLDDDECS